MSEDNGVTYPTHSNNMSQILHQPNKPLCKKTIEKCYEHDNSGNIVLQALPEGPSKE